MNVSQTILKDSPHRILTAAHATREMVHARTEEIALEAGRNSYEINQRDYEQAKVELTGERDFDKQQASMDFYDGCPVNPTGW